MYAYPQGVSELADGLVGAGQRAVVALLEQITNGRLLITVLTNSSKKLMT
jgi:hypothetical protein